MRTVEKTVYQFDELSDEAKERAREWYRDGALDYEWWDSIYEYFKEICKILGISLKERNTRNSSGKTIWEPCVWFSGFSSQGDGASFEGEYSYSPGSVKKLKEYAPNDKELHRIALELSKLQRKFFYTVTGKITHRGGYYHSRTMSVDLSDQYGGLNYDNEKEFYECFVDLADWLYRQLEQEHDYRLSDESVDESIRTNEYEFTEEGRRYV